MEIDSGELGNYVKSTIEGEGGIKIKVVNVGGSLCKENVSKIKFKVGRHYNPTSKEHYQELYAELGEQLK